MKRCSKCKEEYPATLEYFYPEKRRGPGALRSTCKVCSAAQTKATRDPDKKREYNQQWAEENRDKRRKSCREWRARNLEEQRERDRLAKAKDPERREKVKAWRINNKDKARQNMRRYFSRKAGHSDDFTNADWQFALDHFKGCCVACGRPAGLFHTLAMDHWIPNSSPDCPGTVPANIVPLCNGPDGCNQSKHARNPEEWLLSKFGKKQGRAILAKVQHFFSQVRKTN